MRKSPLIVFLFILLLVQRGGELESAGVGESGASPSVVRRSRRKMVAHEAETNHTESAAVVENDVEVNSACLYLYSNSMTLCVNAD